MAKNARAETKWASEECPTITHKSVEQSSAFRSSVYQAKYQYLEEG